MRTALIFVSVYLFSIVAAYAAGIQIAGYFFLQEEFIAILFALIIYSLIAIAAFAAAYYFARNARVLAWVALALAVIAVAIEGFPALVESFARRSTNPAMLGNAQDNAIAVSFLLPALSILLIQWPLLRRRWLVMRGQEHRMQWPWITTFVGIILLANPIGLDLMSSLFRSRLQMMVELFQLIAYAGLALLLAMGVIEWLLRRQWLTRRKAKSV